MSEEQPNLAPITPTVMPGILGTKIPAAVTFGIAVLLFFMPFINIKCNSLTLQKVSGAQLATGFKIESPGSDNTLVGSFEKMDKGDSKVSQTGEENDPNIFALAAFGLGIIAFILSLVEKKEAITGGVITGILGAVALIATLIDIKRKVKIDLSEMGHKAKDSGATDFEKLGDSMSIAVDFTAWFYITVIAFAAGAWFSYKRMLITNIR
jgi:hypothetical protein